jgi:glycosyltransferase involved in cell wall biosynthesis
MKAMTGSASKKACAAGGRFARVSEAASDETPPETYSMSDLFMILLAGDGFGIAFREAMASGTPELGFDLDGVMTRLLAAPKSDPNWLAETMCSRLGWTVSHARVDKVDKILDRLSSSA